MGNPAFHPYAAQEILSIHPSVFALIRTSLDGKTRTLCLNNVSKETQEITVDMPNFSSLTDILSKKEYSIIDNQLKIKIAPYEVIWLTN